MAGKGSGIHMMHIWKILRKILLNIPSDFFLECRFGCKAVKNRFRVYSPVPSVFQRQRPVRSCCAPSRRRWVFFFFSIRHLMTLLQCESNTSFTAQRDTVTTRCTTRMMVCLNALPWWHTPALDAYLTKKPPGRWGGWLKTNKQKKSLKCDYCDIFFAAECFPCECCSSLMIWVERQQQQRGGNRLCALSVCAVYGRANH